MKINYYNIDKEYSRIQHSLNKDIASICKSGNFILGKYVKKFESIIKKKISAKYVLAVGNGTDALEIALRVKNIGYGDEVITAPNSFISTVNAIINVGAKPKFVDIDDSFNMNPDLLIKSINKKTKAIMPVHLNGLPACMKKIVNISKKKKLVVIEDAAQSILSRLDKKFTGTIGDIGCFSLHPTKNLGALGDGGFMTFKNVTDYRKAELIRNHGIKKQDKISLIGVNSRLDEIQAAALIHKIKYLKSDIKKRRRNAKIYNDNLSTLKKFIKTPKFNCCSQTYHTFHRYVIKCHNRDKLYKYLILNGIDVKIHYRTNISDQKIVKKITGTNNFKNLNKISKQILSLPVNQYLEEKDIKFVINKINSFYS